MGTRVNNKSNSNSIDYSIDLLSCRYCKVPEYPDRYSQKRHELQCKNNPRIPKPKHKAIKVTFHPDTIAKLDKYCQEHGTNRTQLIRDYIEDILGT